MCSTAMNVPEDWAKGTVRFSVGRMTTEAEIDRAIEVVVRRCSKTQTEVKLFFLK